MMGVTTAAVLGASGNVGQVVVRSLVKEQGVGKVVLFVRKPIPAFSSETKVEQVVTDLDPTKDEQAHNAQAAAKDEGSSAKDQDARPPVTIRSCKPLLQNVDHLFITIGVGQPSKVTEEELRRVDVEIPSVFAEVAANAGVPSVSLLTSVGANPAAKPSWITKTAAGGGLYSQCKGQIEEKLSAMSFQSVSIFRPATLLGNTNTPSLANTLAPKLDFMLPAKYNSIHIDKLGKAMVIEALKSGGRKSTDNAEECQKPRVKIYEGNSLFKLLA